MSKFTQKLTNAFAAASIGGAAGASLGGSVVSGISAVGGSLCSPVGTFSVPSWELLSDNILATALLDRLLHHAHVVNIRGQFYGQKAMAEEILSIFIIEHIDTARDIVRKILSGYAPVSESQNRIYGMKKGLEFIGDLQHKITQENGSLVPDITASASGSTLILTFTPLPLSAQPTTSAPRRTARRKHPDYSYGSSLH